MVGFIVALYAVAEFGRARLSQAAADVQRAHEQRIRVTSHRSPPPSST